MTDLVNRLRHFGKLFGYDVKLLFEDAADEIERMRKAMETIINLSDLEMRDGDEARRIAVEALSAPVASSTEGAA